MNKFVTGDLKHYYLNWKSIANDEIILDIIRNVLKNDFKENPRYISVPKMQSSATKIQHRKREHKFRNLKTIT